MLANVFEIIMAEYTSKLLRTLLTFENSNKVLCPISLGGGGGGHVPIKDFTSLAFLKHHY